MSVDQHDDYFIKKIEIEPGVEISLDRKMPFGMIYLTLNVGQLPEKYQGAYTTTDAATQAVNLYKTERKNAQEELFPSEAKPKKVRK